MEPSAIEPKNNVQTNWINALQGDRNVDAGEAETIIAAAIKSGIGFDDSIFASHLARQVAMAEATGFADAGDVYDLSGATSLASAKRIVGAVRDHQPGLAGQVYNALARKAPNLAKIGRPLINAYGNKIEGK